MSDWVVLELSQTGEQADPETLVRLLNKLLNGEREIFVPAVTYVKRGIPTTLYYFQGYVFVRAGLPSGRYFDLLSNSYFSSVLSYQEGHHTYLQLLPNEEIDKIKETLRTHTQISFAEGDQVEFISGTYKGLTGVCLGMITEDTCSVKIKMRSIESLVSIPVAMLRLKDLEPVE